MQTRHHSRVQLWQHRIQWREHSLPSYAPDDHHSADVVKWKKYGIAFDSKSQTSYHMDTLHSAYELLLIFAIT